MDWAITGVRREGADVVVRIRNHSLQVIPHLDVSLGRTRTDVDLLPPDTEIEVRLVLP